MSARLITACFIIDLSPSVVDAEAGHRLSRTPSDEDDNDDRDNNNDNDYYHYYYNQ